MNRHWFVKLAVFAVSLALYGCAGVEKPTVERAVVDCEKAGGIPTFNWSGYMTGCVMEPHLK